MLLRLRVTQSAGPQKEFLWQWVTLDFGQSLLVKRRRDLQTIPDRTRPCERLVELAVILAPVENRT